MAKITINKDYFKNMPKGTQSLKIKLKDGHAEGTFKVDDKITFYIHPDLEIPFTATVGQTWGEWIIATGGASSGNDVIWVGFDSSSIYIDPRSKVFAGSSYSWETLASSSLRLLKAGKAQTVGDIIEATLYNCDACCFDAGTQILIADKTLKAIEDITAGEQVISYNLETGSFEVDVVTKTIIKPDSDDLVFIKLSDGTKLGMRAYHPLLTTNGWKSLRPALAETVADVKEPITLLDIGDEVVTIDGTATIIEIIAREDIPNYNTYNLTVAKNHNYLANGVVAHNAGCPC
jgi:hypothetical protein